MKKTKKALALALAAAMCTGVFTAMAADDEPVTSDWYKQESAGYVSSSSCSAEIDWTQPITRNVFALQFEGTVIKRLADDSVLMVLDECESKVSIERLAELGVYLGDEGGLRSRDTITREEAAVVINRIINLVAPDLEWIDLAAEITDAEDISDWAVEAVDRMVVNGYMTGDEDGNFMPKGMYTIEQAVAVSNRIYNDLADKLNLNEASLTPSPTATPQPYNDGTYVGYETHLNSLMPDDENYTFSPYSLKCALLLAANGASGDTRDEILAALNIDDLDAANEQMKETLERYAADETITIDIANAIWKNSTTAGDADFLESYTDTLAKFYNATAETVTSNNAVATVNDWCSENTGGKIPAILDANDSNFWYALTNAVYLDAEWQTSFKAERTHTAEFTERDGDKVETEFMTRTGYYNYAETDYMRMIELPYKTDGDNDISMYIIMDGDSSLLSFSTVFDTELKSTRVTLTMPKFTNEYTVPNLDELLKEIGINAAFNKDKADFSEMCEDAVENEVRIDTVKQKAYIAVDEQGTVAAAATAVGMVGTSALAEEPIEFNANSPFTYVIRDNTSGELLFVGEYAYVK